MPMECLHSLGKTSTGKLIKACQAFEPKEEDMSAGLLLVSHAAVESVKSKLSFHILQERRAVKALEKYNHTLF